ncbi:hypothetical protein B296_00051630 [Ensete ventricosum]|uniref:Uncharacterized protein n=1 Tax=Ensete ventricosum TaxID=4639 RepID=A0A426YFZ0_ENSVE|nr:hypothetical protein B296_00051630 [Ensete ventricosum]
MHVATTYLCAPSPPVAVEGHRLAVMPPLPAAVACARAWTPKCGLFPQAVVMHGCRPRTILGLAWKARIEKMYAELGQMEVGFFSPEEEAQIDKGFEELKAAKKEARREAGKAMAKQRQMEGGTGDQTPNAPEIAGGDK